jgi:glycosyltransferase involved in cell wall biosynthesis
LQLLQLGTIEPRKGQDITCAAMRLLKDQPVELTIVGRVGVIEYHKQLLASCADLPQIRLLPEVDPSQTPALIAGCDAVLVPSRDEVTPLVILEAMSAGKPVIASAIGGIPEMIVDGQTGFLFPPQDARQLADIIARLAKDLSARESVAAAAQRFVRAERTLEQYRDRFVEILTGLPAFK